MKPKSQESSGQIDLFNTPLADLLNPRHELYQLANLIDWKVLDDAFGEFFTENQGAPALPTRLIAGLHYLKHAFARSDEAVVAQWLENPYWQYFCGEEYFQHQMPCHPTSLTYWRKRIGEEGCRQHLVRLAEQHEITLRQNYNRKAPYLLMMANRYSHAKQMKRKRKMLKQLKTVVGRVYRDIERQLTDQSDAVKLAFKETLEKTQRILNQQPQDKNKLYSFHATEVECISKGKVHKKYEFGVKVGITVTNKSNFVLGARSFSGNPYDGHTLESCLEQAEILSGRRAKEAFVDLGYRGVEVPNVTIYKARQKRGINTRRLKHALKRRNAIEPVIGHLKNDGLLGRNYLKGELGDAMHAILCGAGHNIRMILRQLRIFLPHFWRPLCRILTRPLNAPFLLSA